MPACEAATPIIETNEANDGRVSLEGEERKPPEPEASPEPAEATLPEGDLPWEGANQTRSRRAWALRAHLERRGVILDIRATDAGRRIGATRQNEFVSEVSHCEAQALREYRAELLALLTAEAEKAAALAAESPEDRERRQTAKRAAMMAAMGPKSRVDAEAKERALRKIAKLGSERSHLAAREAAEAIAGAFAPTDRDPEASRLSYEAMADRVRCGRLDAEVLAAAFESACRPEIRSSGAFLSANLKRLQ